MPTYKVKILCWIALILPTATFSSEILIKWGAPTERADGVELNNNEIAAYNLSHKIPGMDAFESLGSVSSEPERTAYEYSYPLNDVSGEYCFQLQTQDIHDLKSDWSEPYCATYIPIMNPTLPANITIEIRIGP